MFSSRIDGDRVAAVTAQRHRSGSRPGRSREDEFEIRRDAWIKRVLPRTMFGRSLLIVVMPLILLQAIATWVFYDRHWAAVSWRLSAGVAGDIGLLIEALKLADSPAETARLLERAQRADRPRSSRSSRGETLPSAIAGDRHARSKTS